MSFIFSLFPSTMYISIFGQYFNTKLQSSEKLTSSKEIAFAYASFSVESKKHCGVCALYKTLLLGMFFILPFSSSKIVSVVFVATAQAL